MALNSDTFTLSPLGHIHSCFTDKFGIPRQPGLCRHARGHIALLPPFDCDDAFRGLDDFSHVWLTFVFHQTPVATFRPLIRPPRLGGNRKQGVFASRSPFRPNRLGLSLVRHHGLFRQDKQLCVALSGLDLVTGTPVLDIKPHLPWCDAPGDASASWAEQPPQSVAVDFMPRARDQLRALKGRHPELEALIRDLLGQDPRPAYKKTAADPRIYGMRLYDIDVHWQAVEDRIQVTDLTPDR
ncbi:MAG: tRNA (N6-threonylcarbamoyladenosine(37)-N6)-methyltransferase TrmO [Halomonadaceae bacterium]|nr:MAG: tRNA (N6-threonylcarbamoyladenosine(37)-N6)-methyltransferase TrmO [Halomonadaceae bacterium]